MPSTISTESYATDILISAEQVATMLSNPAVLPVFIGSEAAFKQAHIPGSVHIHPAELVCGIAPATGKLPDADDLSLLFSRIGLNDQRIVIAYDDEGGGWAGRLIWTLDVIGHSQYYYLDGGIIAWQAELRPIDSGVDSAMDTNDHSTDKLCEPYEITINSEHIVSADNIIKSLEQDNFIVWDARSAQEYSGEKILAARGGHIPGAANLDWLDLIDRNNHCKLKPLTEIKKMLVDRNITEDKSIVTHCQTHHRSGLTYLVGKLLNLNIKAYDGSWSEWGNLTNTPINNTYISNSASE